MYNCCFLFFSEYQSCLKTVYPRFQRILCVEEGLSRALGLTRRFIRKSKTMKILFQNVINVSNGRTNLIDWLENHKNSKLRTYCFLSRNETDKCKYCTNETEDLTHFLLNCSEYNCYRNKFYRLI